MYLSILPLYLSSFFLYNRFDLVPYVVVFPRPRIKQLIERGTMVVMDRYAFSGVAFTAAKEVIDTPFPT